MWQAFLPALMGAVRGGSQADSGQGMKDLGTGFRYYDPGDPSKKMSGTVAGFAGGLLGGSGGGGGALMSGAGGGSGGAAGGLMGMLQERKAEDKQNKQMAKLFDQSSDLMKEGGILGADVDPNDLSQNEKAAMMRTGMEKIRLMQQIEQAQPRGDWRPSVVELETGERAFMTSPKSAQLITGEEQEAIPWQPGDPMQARYGNTVLLADPVNKRFRAQRPRLKTDMLGMQVQEDISGLPEWVPGRGFVEAQQDAPTAEAPAVETLALSERDQQALEWARANPNDPRAVEIFARLGVQ